MDEVHRAGYVGGVQSFHAFFGPVTSLFVHQFRSSANPIISDLYGTFILWARLIRSLAIGDGFHLHLLGGCGS